MKMVAGEKERKSQDDVLRRKYLQDQVPSCERGCGRIRLSPFKIQVYSDLFVKCREGPRGGNL